MNEPLKRSRAWALALVATATMAVSYFDRQTLAVLAPTVTKELGISETAYGWLLSAFSIAYLVGAPLAGRLLDVIGARRGLLGAVIAWSFIAGLHAIAPGYAVLFVLRIALGLGEAPSFPGAAQTVQRALPPDQRAKGFGILFTGSSFGAMLAPPIATFLEARYNWRVAFLGTALVGLSWVPLWLWIAYSRDARAVLDVREEKHETPKVPLLDLLKMPAVLRFVAVVLASAPFLNLCFNWGPKYLVSDHGLAQSEIGFYLVFPPLVFDAGSIAFGAAGSRLARTRGGSVPPWLMGLAGALAALGSLTPFAGSPAACIAVASIALAGGAGLYGLGTADVLGRVPPHAVGAAAGIGAAAQSLVYIIVNPFIIGPWVQAAGNYTNLMVTLGVLVLPGALIWMVWKPPVLEAIS